MYRLSIALCTAKSEYKIFNAISFTFLSPNKWGEMVSASVIQLHNVYRLAYKNKYSWILTFKHGHFSNSDDFCSFLFAYLRFCVPELKYLYVNSKEERNEKKTFVPFFKNFNSRAIFMVVKCGKIFLRLVLEESMIIYI